MTQQTVSSLQRGLQNIAVGAAISLIVWFVIFFKDVPSRNEVEQMINKRLITIEHQIEQQEATRRDLQESVDELNIRLAEISTTLKLMRENNG